jgi:hypothetical protein
MGYKPEDLFVGVIDFFAVLLPGALISFVIADFARHHLFGKALPAIQGEAQGWVVFAFSSYLLGHFVFLVGSYVDPLYNRLRRRFIPKEKDLTYLRAKAIKEKRLADNPREMLMNTFQWAKATMQLRSPGALVEVRRHEADSKFFRSLIVVLLVIVIFLIARGAWLESIFCLVLVGASFGRYAEQRWKAAQRAYEYLLAIELLDGRTPLP